MFVRENFLGCLLLIAAALSATGCTYRLPRFWDFRSPAMQRMQLQRFDPYPDNDIGPAMVGVRPPDFGQQITEPARSRWNRGAAAPYFVP